MSVCVRIWALGVPAARAACNLIPGTVRAYNNALGTTNRPFAAPGSRGTTPGLFKARNAPPPAACVLP